MKKKFTNEEIGQLIGKMAEKLRDEMDYEFRVAQSQMWIAEKDLVDSLTEEQYELYRDYSEREPIFTKSQKNFTQGNFKKQKRLTKILVSLLFSLKNPYGTRPLNQVYSLSFRLFPK